MNKSKPKISIIIPVYNVEKYIKQCLDSLVNQDYGIENLEIIVIDDCSQDRSREIAQTFQKKYPQSFKIIKHKVNKKAGGARNTGLKSATGDFVSFIDPDDFIDKKTYAYLIPKMIETNADMCAFGFLHFFDDGRTQKPSHDSLKLFKEEKLISHQELLTSYTEFLYSMSVWNKIYKRELLSGIEKFKEDELFNEDAKFSLDTFLKARRILLSDKSFYFYRKNNSSATSKSYTSKESYKIHFDYHIFLDKLAKKYPELEDEINIFFLNNWSLFIHNIILNKINLTQKERVYYFKKSKELLTKMDTKKYKTRVHFFTKLLFFCLKKSKNITECVLIYKLTYFSIMFFYKNFKKAKLLISSSSQKNKLH